MVIRFQRLLHDGLYLSATKCPDKPVVHCEDETYTYRDLLGQASQFASVLLENGFNCSERVAIYMDNTWPCVVSIYGTLLAGGTFVVINPQTKADKLTYILDDSKAKVLVSDGHLAKVFSSAVETNQHITLVMCSGQISEDTTIFRLQPKAFFDVLDNAPPFKDPKKSINLDLAAIIYTSGSTGEPKGVMMTHQSMTFACQSIIEYLRIDDIHSILCVLPLAFDYGLYQLLMTIQTGATLILERSFTFPTAVFNRMEQYDATVFPGVPTIFSTLLSMHQRNPKCFPKIKRITNTAAALPAEFIASIKEIFPNALIYAMYGLTECKRVCFLEPELIDAKPNSVGKAIPGTETFILKENGERAKPGEIGILHVRGTHIMKGYLNKPEITQRMLRQDPVTGETFLCTQDIFSCDEEGFLYFKGRNDDIIKTRGEKVSPVEVENTLYGFDGIREAAVIGVDDPHLGEAIKAFVVLEQGSPLDEKAIKKLCMSHLENFMVPKVVEILDELPKTNTGKISKKNLT